MAERVDDELEAWLDEALAPEPLTESATSRELVCKAVQLSPVERVPYSLVRPVRSDFFELAALMWRQRRRRTSEVDPCRSAEPYLDEWGIERQRSQGLFDRVIESPLENLEALDEYAFPEPGHFAQAWDYEQVLRRAFDSGKYVVGYDAVNLYDRVVALAGLGTALRAPFEDRQRLESLLDRLTELTILQIDAYACTGLVQGFMTWQDFCAQSGLVMSIEDFRSLYRPRLERMIERAHSGGMHFIWHCCGAAFELVREMAAMNVDVVQLDQPKLSGYARLARSFGEDICFWNTLDTIWSVQKDRSPEELRAEVALMQNAWAGISTPMFRHYPQPDDIQLPDEALEAIAREFVEF